MSFKGYMDRIENRVVNTVHYEAFIFVGILIAVLSLIKVLGIYDFSSDWLWFLAGVGLMVEGAISLIKQRKFDRKYKIIERKD
ncbi:MAG: hypothetical protein WC796_02680 [Candidatus Pacearchaeota archaeon]|jgi:hypothetical protein